MRSLFIAPAIALCATLVGCASPHPAPRFSATEALIGSAAARQVPLYRGDGPKANWQDMISAAASADVVVIGEMHGHPLGSAAEVAIWDDLLVAPGVADHAVLSMEFFDRSEQPKVDDFLTGLTDEAAFKKATNRSDTASYPLGHQVMVRTAKAHKVSIIASNAPRVYVRAARQDGYEKLQGLTADQKRLFRIPDRLPADDSDYRKRFDETMSANNGHAGTPGKEPTPEEAAKQKETLDASFRSQSMWDWTMAESIARAAGEGHRPVVHVIGRFHSDLDGGLLQALRQLHPGLKTVVISMVETHDSGELKSEDQRRADFVLYVGPAEEE